MSRIDFFSRLYVVGLRDCVSDNRAMNEKLQTILTELREKLQSQYDERLVNVILFGSQARGDATWERRRAAMRRGNRILMCWWC